MNSKIIANGILRSLVIIVGVALLLYFIYLIRSVIGYVVIAAIISILGNPLVNFFSERLKFNNLIAVIIVMILFIGIVLGIISLFIPLVIEQSQNLSLLDVNELENNIERIYIEFINHFGINETEFESQIMNSKFISDFEFEVIPDFLNSVISGFGNFSIGLFSVIFILFFFLKDSSMLSKTLLSIFPEEEDRRLKRILISIRDLLSRYFGGLLLQILILFSIYSIILSIFGINNALIIATLCALLNIIPYLGPVLSAFLICLLTITSNLGQDFSTVILPRTIYVMVGFTIAQLVDNFFTQPFIFSKSVKSQPLEIFLIIIVFGLLFGTIGLVVAVPLYTSIKVIAKEFLSEYRIVKKLTKNL